MLATGKYSARSFYQVPTLRVSDLEKCLTQKLKAAEESGNHRKFKIYDADGSLIATTQLSHSWRGSTQISDHMVGAIRAQMSLDRTSQLLDLISCTLSREQYLVVVRGEPPPGPAEDAPTKAEQ